MRGFLNVNTFYTITKKVDFFPPWKKCVKKIYECSVKKENLFEDLKPEVRGIKRMS